jgi:hypothetical protein
MIVQRNILPLFATVAGLLVFYWASWELHCRTRSSSRDPFANESSYDRAAGVIFSPIQRYHWAKEAKRERIEGRRTMQGTWVGEVFVDGEVACFTVNRRSFSIQEDEDERVPYIVTDLGKIHVQPPSALFRNGGSSDEQYFRTLRFRGWSEEDLLLKRRAN